MKTKRLFTLFILLFFLSAHAQTLKEVVRGTIISNPEIQALRLNTKAYRFYVDEEKGKLLPTLDLETYAEELNRERDNEDDSRLSGSNTQLKLEQTLFNGWLTQSQIEEAKQDLKATQYKNFSVTEDVVLDVIDAYLNVVKNEEIRLLSENNLLIHEDYLEVAAQSEAVSGDTLDRMQVESKIFSANAKFSEVKRDAAQAKATLEKIYGEKLDNNICRPIVQTKEFDNLETLITKVLNVNYSILEEIQRIKTQRAIVTQEKSRFYPTITAKLLHEVDDGIDAKDIKKTENSFRISLSYNIFNGGQDSAILEREKIFLQEAQKTLDDVVNGVIEEVKINYTNFHTSKKRIAYLKDYLEKNKDILIVYLEQFEGGTRSFLDILNHEAELFRAKTDLIQEQFTNTLAYYELLNLMSKLSPTVLSSKKQICEPIKVDIERRQLSTTTEDIDNDEELNAIFEEGEDAALLEEGSDKDAKVQSMLNKILNEVYDPNMVNKNISVSKISYSDDIVKIDPLGDEAQNGDITELIKIKQELEEQALREEHEVLKSQIKEEAKKLVESEYLEENSTPKAEQKEAKKVNKPLVITTIDEQTQRKKEAVQELREAALRNAKAFNEARKKSLQSKQIPPPIKKITKTLSSEKETQAVSLKTLQVQSQQLEEKYKQSFRQAHGLDEFGRIKKQKVSKDIPPVKVIKEIEKQPIAKTEKQSVQKKSVYEATLVKKEVQKIVPTAEKPKKTVVKNMLKEHQKTEEELEKPAEQLVTKPLQTQPKSLQEKLFETDSKEYTIGISTLSFKKESSFIKKEYGLKNQIAIYKLRSNNRDYYKVIYGLYKSVKEAKEAAKNLPSVLRKNGVLIKRMSTHQKLFKKYNPELVQNKEKVPLLNKIEPKEKQSVQPVNKELLHSVEKQLPVKDKALEQKSVLDRALKIKEEIKEEKTLPKLPTMEEKKKSPSIEKVESKKTTIPKINKSPMSDENTPLIKNRLKEELLGPLSTKYTLGILTLSSEKKADFIKKQYNLSNNVVIYKSQNNGKIYFKVLYGFYENYEKAKEDIKNLDPSLRKSGVFVNRISTHQKLFRKYNPNGEL